MFIEKFLFLLACHFLADFAFQSAYLAEKKATSTEHLLYHGAQYTATFIVFVAIASTVLPFPSAVPLFPILLLFFSHILIDALKARIKLIKPIWLDQLLHISILLALLSFNFY